MFRIIRIALLVSLVCVSSVESQSRRIYVSSPSDHKIVAFDLLREPSTFRRRAGRQKLNAPTGLFVDGSDRMYVADTGNHRIVSMADFEGNGWQEIGSKGDGKLQFNRPQAVFKSSRGQIFVSDTGNDRIIRMDDMSGKGWTAFGSKGTGTEQFNRPVSVVVDDSDRVYVADSGNGRVIIFRNGREIGGEWSEFLVTDGKTTIPYFPHGIAVDNDARVYISAYGGALRSNLLIRINDIGGSSVVRMFTGQTIAVNHLVVDETGRIYGTNFYGADIIIIDRIIDGVLAPFDYLPPETRPVVSGPFGIAVRSLRNY